MSSVLGGRDGTVDRKYGEYPAGKRAPSIATIDEVEAKLPGTRPIIQNLLWPILHGEMVPTHRLRARGDVLVEMDSSPLTFEGLELHLVAAALAKIDQSVDQLTLCVNRLHADTAKLPYVPELTGDLEGVSALWSERIELFAQDLATMRDALLQHKAIQRRALSPSGLYARLSNRRELHLSLLLSSMSAIVFAVNTSQVAVEALVLVLSTLCTFSSRARRWYAVDGVA